MNFDLPNMLEADAVADLLTGARRRYDAALWLARERCDDAKKDNAANGYDEIRFAEAQLAEAKRQLGIIRDLEKRR